MDRIIGVQAEGRPFPEGGLSERVGPLSSKLCALLGTKGGPE